MKAPPLKGFYIPVVLVLVNTGANVIMFLLGLLSAVLADRRPQQIFSINYSSGKQNDGQNIHTIKRNG